jgi:hypothetical protein
MRQLDIFRPPRAPPKPQCGHLRLLYATSMLSVYEGRMIALVCSSRPRLRAGAAMALFVSGIGLAGCASLGDGAASGAFVDPAKYELYNCTQLAAERTALRMRAAELEGLMAKADTGAAGPVVAELAYRNDLIFARAQAKLAEEAWRRNKCVETPAAAAAPPPAPPAAAKQKQQRRPGPLTGPSM